MWRDPGGNEAQRGALHSMRRWNYLIGGRGLGKTAWLCMRAFLFASMKPGLEGMITEQTAGMINEILVPCWKRIVPPGVSTLQHNQYGWEVRFQNGSIIRFRSRHAKDAVSDPPFHGQTIGWLGHDELSLDRRLDVMSVSGMMVRQEGMPNICDVSATPRRNWLYSHCMGKGLVEPGAKRLVSPDGQSAIFYGPTRDNPYNEGLHDRMIGEISEAEARQYLFGEWVDVEGIIWDTFSEDEYPAGNMINDGGFREKQDYILSVDHGSNDASWGLWQARGNGAYSRVAEYTPSKIPAYRVAHEIQKRYGKPGRIITGADHVTRGNAGLSADHLFTSLGWVPAERVTGDLADKEIQGNTLARQICASTGRRQVLISRQMECHYPGKTRGALDLLKGDTWPDSDCQTYFRKEKGDGIYHEDTRDEMLYFAIVMWPPQWAAYGIHAA